MSTTAQMVSISSLQNKVSESFSTFTSEHLQNLVHKHYTEGPFEQSVAQLKTLLWVR